MCFLKKSGANYFYQSSVEDRLLIKGKEERWTGQKKGTKSNNMIWARNSFLPGTLSRCQYLFFNFWSLCPSSMGVMMTTNKRHLLILILYAWVHSLYALICVPYVWSACRSQKIILKHVELEWWTLVNHHVAARNWPWVLCKSL